MAVYSDSYISVLVPTRIIMYVDVYILVYHLLQSQPIFLDQLNYDLSEIVIILDIIKKTKYHIFKVINQEIELFKGFV